MSFDVVEHTADVRVVVEAETVEALFADALRGVMSVMAGVFQPGAPYDVPGAMCHVPSDRGTWHGERGTLQIETDSPDLTALLVDFLNDALVLVHTRRCTFEPVSIVLDGTAVRAELRAAGPLNHDVKAVTYHEADVREEDGLWRTNLVLDI